MPQRARAGEEAKGQKCIVRGRGQSGVGHTRFYRAVRNALLVCQEDSVTPSCHGIARVRARCRV